MSNLNSKEQILEDNGFTYIPDRMIYVNKQKKKIFTHEAVEDHDEKWLNDNLNKSNTDWEFYSNGNISKEEKEAIIKRLSK
ncbi:hypothetical protein [Legionella pneumophila]|uniref:hypothetical protein n=1 Tax=Legionella pneumophila TaxID=446 RepID=UPI000770A9D3|nr:hypothetical protein [Legionella pneumophila]MCH9108486.1 hypothetical protein [Legionella pneumophila serogroup 1]MCH9115076.1 hypothetical protein [Legionella pneumophila serogroup 1]MDW8895634.1 hypothetical protein [Legionella pneumophila]MDW9033712.1 hypothetical protein [Legionella pneumophila]MDW9048698.1 hypothetical protein [Legionella pneumophila]